MLVALILFHLFMSMPYVRITSSPFDVKPVLLFTYFLYSYLASGLYLCSFCIVLFSFVCVCVGKAAFTKKQADLFFPPEFSDDFPVAMQVCSLQLPLIKCILGS